MPLLSTLYFSSYCVMPLLSIKEVSVCLVFRLDSGSVVVKHTGSQFQEIGWFQHPAPFKKNLCGQWRCCWEKHLKLCEQFQFILPHVAKK